MRVRSVLSGALLATTCLLSVRQSFAFCRTMTCPLQASWSPTAGCTPPDFALYCASLNPPARVLPIWWRGSCVSYDIQKNASRSIPYDVAVRVIDKAFAKWTGARCAADAAGAMRVSIEAINLGPVDCDQVGYNKFGGPNQHVIVFRDAVWPHNDANNTLGLTTVTFDADTGELYDADTEINGTVPLSVSDQLLDGGYDFESIVTHEMGHFLGLAHSGDTSATMYARYTPHSTSMRILTPDDVAGICAIYPPDGTRNVDPSVAANGKITADACDPTPRHGFTTQCPQPLKRGCAIAPGEPRDSPTGIVLGIVASLGIARWRKRAPRTSPT